MLRMLRRTFCGKVLSWNAQGPGFGPSMSFIIWKKLYDTLIEYDEFTWF